VVLQKGGGDEKDWALEGGGDSDGKAAMDQMHKVLPISYRGP